MLTWATLMMTMIMWLMLTHPEVPWSSPWFSTPCSIQARRTQPPSESLPASYGPGAGMMWYVQRLCVPLCAPVGSALASAGFAPPSTPLRASRQATAPEQGCGCACLPAPPLCPSVDSRGFTPPSTPLRVSRQATAPEQGCGCACLPVPPLCPSVGSVLILASSALLSAPLRASRSATAPEQGRGHDRLAGVSVYPPMGVIFGEALYPVPSHYTCTVGSSVGSPRRLLNDRTLSPLHPLPPLGLILLYWRWGLTRGAASPSDA